MLIDDMLPGNVYRLFFEGVGTLRALCLWNSFNPGGSIGMLTMNMCNTIWDLNKIVEFKVHTNHWSWVPVELEFEAIED